MSPADDGALAEAADERTIRAVFDDWRVVATEEEHMVIGADGQIRDVMVDKALRTLLPVLHQGVAVCPVAEDSLHVLSPDPRPTPLRPLA